MHAGLELVKPWPGPCQAAWAALRAEACTHLAGVFPACSKRGLHAAVCCALSHCEGCFCVWSASHWLPGTLTLSMGQEDHWKRHSPFSHSHHPDSCGRGLPFLSFLVLSDWTFCCSFVCVFRPQEGAYSVLAWQWGAGSLLPSVLCPQPPA